MLSEADNSLTQPGPSGLHACHVSVSGSFSSDEKDEIPDQPEDFNPFLARRKLPKARVQVLLRASKHGRRRAREGPSTKCHGRVHLLEYTMSATEYVRSAADGKTSIPAHKVLAKSVSDKM